MIELILIYLIVFLGIINSVRMTSYFLLGEVYNLQRENRRKGKIAQNLLISIIVPAYNEETVILRTIQSVLASNYRNLEVIVVDDGSKDRTGDLVQNYIYENKLTNVTLVRQSNGGKARALNNGIKNYARGNLIMTLDADSIISNDAVGNAVNYFQDKDIAAIASNVRIMKSKQLLGKIQYLEYLTGHRLKKAFSVINNEYIVGGVGSTFRASVLEAVNYYDTDTITEDIDLTMKILRLGNKANKVMFASDVVCYTEPVMSFRDLYKQRLRWKYGRFQTLFKNRDMFFNLSKKYTRALTFVQLPFVIYSELAFLLDPILMGFMVYLSVKYLELSSIFGVLIFVAFYSFLTIATDEYMSLREKVAISFYAPFTYIMFFTVSVVEYISLLKSIIDVKRIVRANEIDECGWEHVARAGQL